jgi:hypothetical protein
MDTISPARGAGTVEYIALTALFAALISVAVGAVLASDGAESRWLASRIGMKIRCAARWPEPCWRDPLTEAYGRPVAGLVRAWATQPAAIAGLVPVDPRRCRSPSCAIAANDRLTISNRRITVFSRVTDRRRRNGTLVVEYLAYRPAVGWATARHIATRADVESFARTPLIDSATPQVIPLEGAPAVAAEAPPTNGRSGTP